MASLRETINSTLVNAAVTHAKYTTADIATVVGTVILALLTIIGVVFIVLIIYGGFRWMLAQGEEQKITEARNVIFQSTIGLIIVLAAYAISYFIVSAVQKAAGL